jgi:hypothetical protein
MQETDLHQYYSAPIDYSEQFSKRVADLAAAIGANTGCPVVHDRDMNYRAAQSLHVFFDRKGCVGDKMAAIVEMRIYVSSKGPVYAVYLLNIRLTNLAYGLRLDPGVLPAAVRQLADDVAARPAAFGLRQIPSSLFEQPAHGCVTELDAKPATIFECLFAEMV